MQILEMTVQCPSCDETVVLDMAYVRFVADEDSDNLGVAMEFKCPACNEFVGPTPID